MELALTGLGEIKDGFDSRIGAELALTGLGEIKDGFDSRIGVELGETGRNIVSATTFSVPGRWRTSQFNSDRNDRWRCCMADQGGEVLNKA